MDKLSSETKNVEIYDDARGIRLDVYVDDDKGTIYNIEMQAANNDNLPKRSRYYESLTDLDILELGATFRRLKKRIDTCPGC